MFLVIAWWSQVIEWVDHCRAFKDYIVDSKGPGGNSRYYPDEPSFTSCKKYFDDAKDAPVDERREVFNHILSRKSPVFRFFFVEMFGHSLEAWHASKLRYTRSVAVNSMVGHVLGIGKVAPVDWIVKIALVNSLLYFCRGSAPEQPDGSPGDGRGTSVVQLLCLV